MAEEHWIWRRDRVIHSDPAAGRQVLDELLAALRAQHWPSHDVFGVHLAVHEALINAISHGNHGDVGKQVRVASRLGADLLRVEISDEGEGFDPGRLPDPTDPDRIEVPSGRGVMLMRAFMSRVEYNACGNSVLLEKRRTDPPPDAAA